MVVTSVVLLLIVLIVTWMNVLYIRNIRDYVGYIRRGMVRVKIKYKQDETTKILKGWAYHVDLGSIIKNPVSHSSSFVKVYEKGHKEVVLAFSTVKKLEVLEENYFSVVFGKRAYL